MRVGTLFAASAFLLSCTLAVGCTGTETGNPSFSQTVGLNTYSSEPARVALRDSGVDVNVAEVWLSIDRVGLVSEADCPDTGRAVTTPSFGADDHADTDAAFVSLTVPEGRFCAATITFVPFAGELPSGAPTELLGNAFVVRGTLGDGTEWRLVDNLSPSVLVLAPADPFELADSEVLLLAFDVAHWLGDLDFGAAVRDANGAIEIGDQNSMLLDAFRSRVATGIELYRDDDGDGSVDARSELLGRGVP